MKKTTIIVIILAVAVLVLAVGLLFFENYKTNYMSSSSKKDSVSNIDQSQAETIALGIVSKQNPEQEFVIQKDKTITKDYGWIFFYTTKEYAETGDMQYQLPGNAPLVVLKEDGSTEFLSSSIPPEQAIIEYEKNRQ